MNSNAFLSFFANDDNYDGEEEKHLPLDNNTAVHHTLVSGGPVKRNYSGMTVAEVNIAREKYKKKWKRYTDKQHHLLSSESSAEVVFVVKELVIMSE